MIIKRTLQVLGLATLLLFTGCGEKNRPNQEQKKIDRNEQGDQPAPEKPESPKKLTISPEQATIDLDKSSKTTVQITSGNGKYNAEVSDGPKEMLTVTVENATITITTTATTKKVTATITITDATTKEHVKLPVVVLPKKIPHHPYLEKAITTTEFAKKSKGEKEKAIEKAISETENILAEIKKVKEYSKETYKAQADLFKTGEEIYGWKLKAYERHKGGKPEMEDPSIDNIYQDIYLYGVGYATVEYLARKANELNLKYPGNEKIKQYLGKIFSGNYGSQEGDQFVIGTNDESVKPYNDIIDIVNEIERGTKN